MISTSIVSDTEHQHPAALLHYQNHTAIDLTKTTQNSLFFLLLILLHD